ncbi:MAG: DUF4349 domain-containing protein [Chloroflexota bacterium]
MVRLTRKYMFPVIISGVLLLVALAACGAQMGGADMRTESVAMAPPMAQQEIAADDGFAISDTETSARVEGGVAFEAIQSTAPAQQEQQRIILKDANMSVVVDDTETTIDSITVLAEGMGGWVVSANSNTQQRGEEDYTTGNITVRVPAENLDSVLNTIREGALRVDSENVNGRDVTEEYVDLSSRLSNLSATEDQLAEVMDSAFTVEDVLAVQRELTRVRGEIEVIEGRLRFFDEAAAFSSVAVTVREEIPTVGNVEVAGWNPLDTVENAIGALIVAGQFLVDTVIVLAILGAPVLLVGWGVFAIMRRMWRRRRSNRTAATATE